MFTSGENREQRRPWGMTASIGLHVILLAILLYGPEPIFLSPKFVQAGDGLKSFHVVYTPSDPEVSDEAQTQPNNLPFHLRHKPRAKPSPVKAKEAPDLNPQGEVADKNAHAGTVYGSIWALMQEGHDVKPAFPVVYPSPDLSHADLPLGYQGEIIVEVTIERDGSVSDMKVIQSVGHGVDEKVLAAVQHWRFRPAILDGSPIASKHDVHFHLPS
jgi:TonB family protein